MYCTDVDLMQDNNEALMALNYWTDFKLSLKLVSCEITMQHWAGIGMIHCHIYIRSKPWNSECRAHLVWASELLFNWLKLIPTNTENRMFSNNQLLSTVKPSSGLTSLNSNVFRLRFVWELTVMFSLSYLEFELANFIDSSLRKYEYNLVSH